MKELFGSSEDFINSFDKYEDENENENEFYKGIDLEDSKNSEDDINYDIIGGSLY
jgi:hypothetical protein